ncbi:PREDICTED: cytochrome b5 domain-containing protein 1 [Polistes dominula]|uniref:Cytochrome b5 domain-containing protein 1 n=1 Tax=Polistes dominula TaxID=743375 RepID=A0ABM1HVZ7_POLDO|nr:PREDICTED: cytochrome b5 domain-containing protein 1 [Polistes dominula]
MVALQRNILDDYEHPASISNLIKHDKYFLPTEVAIHNKSNDCWVSYNDNVYDLTDLCRLWLGTRAIKPIIAHAGKDISHWFDHNRKDIKYYVHPVTGVSVPYCPHGPIPDISDCVVPSTTWRPLNKCPWWLEDKYKLGKLTKNPRPCRIINVLTGTSCVIMVCEEDTIKRIQERALIFNANGKSYLWKFEGKDIDLDCTLTENNILDERERFVACGLPEDYYIPSLMCYYIDKDDLGKCQIKCRRDKNYRRTYL